MLFSISLWGNEFQTVAENFLQFKGIDKEITKSETIEKDGLAVGNIFYLSNGGYIVVPTSQNASPIKAFSFKSPEIPDLYREHLANSLAGFYKNGLARATDSRISERWDFLKNYETSSRTLNTYTPNTNLLSTTWDQGYPYNKFMPEVDGENTLTGCVQTAMAQVLNYHGYPDFGRKTNSFDAKIYNQYNGLDRTETMRAVYSRNYNWNIMPDNFSSDYNESSADEVALLMRDLAVLNEAVEIGINNTAASAKLYNLHRKLQYSRNFKYADGNSHTFAEMFEIIKTQIDSELPVLLSIPGHMVVADGYQTDESGKFVHLNMGWGGYQDDFYNLDEDISSEYPQATYNDLSIQYDIKPCSEEAGDCFVNLEENETMSNYVNDTLEETDIESYTTDSNMNLVGELSSTSDVDEFIVYLSGNIEITRTNRYFNIALYTFDGDLISESMTNDISTNIETGKYKIKLSNSSSTGTYYPSFTSGNYDLTITTDEVNPSEIEENLPSIKTIKGNLYDDLDIDKYDIFLEGNFSIVRTSQYYNLALYKYNNFGGSDLLMESQLDNLVATDLEAGKYRVVFSRQNSAGSYYYTGSKDYEVQLIGNELNSSEAFAVRIGYDSIPEIDTDLPDRIISKPTDILLNIYDANGDDFTTSIETADSVLNKNLNRNILTLSPIETNKIVDITVKLDGRFDTTAEKTFKVITLDSDLALGENANIGGNYKNGTDIYSHEVVLDGKCTIKNSYGYFSITDSDGNLVSDWGNSQRTLSADYKLYKINVSLDDKSSGYYYPFDSSKTAYSISVSCENFDTDITRLLEIFPEIQTVSSNPNIDFTISLNSQWNLISNPSDSNPEISTLSDKTQFVFKFEGNDWVVWQNGNYDDSNYQTFSTFDSESGYWFYQSESSSITVSGNSATCPDFAILDSGWHLLGSCEKTVSEIISENENIAILYKFVGADWELAGNSEKGFDQEFFDRRNLTTFTEIKADEGFWIYLD
ncbi:Peptidase C10 family [Thiovulum sp. ES]|nr:Peptidase C10 family [Thiovulum sp. ES]